ncbi:MAG: hypothetical protein QGI78_07615 [Phycisphaerales bacterium]|nr:hypothetical protein [Phycisphaerales bacterium]
MIHYALLIILVLTSAISVEHTEFQLDGTDGVAYIELAEDMLDDATSKEAVQFARKCYVLSAQVNPNLKKSAILALIAIETDAKRRDVLRSSISSETLLPHDIVLQGNDPLPSATPQEILTACEILEDVRTGGAINIGGRSPVVNSLLEYVSRSFEPSIRDIVLNGGRARASEFTSTQTLKAELQLLGGSSQWSAAIVLNGAQPRKVFGTLDLPSIMQVDVRHYLYKNGRWYAP